MRCSRTCLQVQMRVRCTRPDTACRSLHTSPWLQNLFTAHAQLMSRMLPEPRFRTLSQKNFSPACVQICTHLSVYIQVVRESPWGYICMYIRQPLLGRAGCVGHCSDLPPLYVSPQSPKTRLETATPPHTHPHTPPSYYGSGLPSEPEFSSFFRGFSKILCFY